MKAVTTEQMRELDRRTIEEHGISGLALMERAGRGVADTIMRIAEMTGCTGMSALVVAGKGNNGGDAFVVARCLAVEGFDVDVCLSASSADVVGDARAHMQKMVDVGLTPREMPDEGGWDDYNRADGRHYDFIIDGVLGTGIDGAARGSAAAAISCMNRLSGRSTVVAIDVPSGLNSDTGEAGGPVAVADVTVTMGQPKQGLLAHCALDYVGNLEVVDIGIPSAFVDPLDSRLELIVPSDLAPLFPRRSRASHKGSYGHVLLLGGAAGFSGAITLAARAAVRSGVGLVSVLVPRSIAGTVAGGVHEAMVHGVDETDVGSLSSDLWAKWRGRITDFDAILMGPGMTTHEETRFLVQDVLRKSKAPLVVDADAINVQKIEQGLLRSAVCPTFITPHPGELGRFSRHGTEAVQSDRAEAATAAADGTKATVVLKGAGTIVAARERTPAINLSGNPGMATGGMGDALAGLLAGLLAQGIDGFGAACAAAYLHGRAADRLSQCYSQMGLTAGDVIEELPATLAEICER